MSRWAATRLAIGAAAFAVGIAVMDRYAVGVFHDDAMYVILAKSLATGQGYRYLNIPGAPFATHFPPGYPAVLALLWSAFPGFPANLVVFKALNAVLLGASAMLTAQLVRDRLGSARWAVGVALVAAVSVPLLVLSTMLLSEILFLALLLAALVIAERVVMVGASTRSIVLLGVLVGIATLVRTHGIVLVVAIAAPLMWRRQWRQAVAFAATALVVLLPWQLWSGAHAPVLSAPLEGNYGSYIGWWIRGFQKTGLSMIPATLSRTVPESGSMLAALFSPMRGAGAHVVTGVALAMLVATAAWLLAARATVTLLFLAGYLAIVLVWPFQPSRFIWGIWPLVLFVLAGGTFAVLTRTDGVHRVARVAVATAFVWVAVGYALYEVRAVRGQWWSSISRAANRRIEPAVAWTRTNTTPMDVVAADDEGAIYLYTGRRAVPVASFTTDHYLSDRSPVVEATEGLEPLLAEFPLSAVLVGSRKTLAAAQYLASRPSPLLAPRAQFDGGAAFTVLPR